MSTHYICTGDCKGTSDVPGVCQDESCSKSAQPLTECNCADGEHAELLNAHEHEPEEHGEEKE